MRLALFAALLLSAHAASGQPVSLDRGKLTLPTYIIHGSEPNPKFYAYEGSIIYPYAMQDDLGEERVDRDYQTVTIENEYLKVICLPHIGGRIHSVLDKTTGEEMFHRNDVIKPGLIAMRGAWISGGIEWNRGPQGHTVTSFAPVNVTSQKHADGSASLVIGYTEKNFRTRWNVRLTLHPGKAYLHETIRLDNPNDGVYSYYFWNNTAFPCKPGTRFIYPMTLGQDHNGAAFFSWPIHDGKDLTWLKNYDEPTSVFAYQCAFDFFGAYDTGDDRGIVQFGDHRVLTGKKAWTWGQSGDGIASQRSLHDDDSQYIEVQSGPLQTQADFGLLGPHQRIAWQEWWYPVHGLGDGFEYATQDVAINTRRTANSLEMRAISTGEFPGAVISIRVLTAKAGPGTIETIDLSPMSAVTVVAPVADGEKAEIEVRSADGALLAAYVSPLDIPVRAPPAPLQPPSADPTAEELYLQGVAHEERIEPDGARAAYEACIARDAGYARAHTALARLGLERAEYASAAAHARAAATRDAGLGLAWYYLSLALMELPENERDGDPMDAAYRAVNTIECAALGHDLAGRIHMRAGEYASAIREFAGAVFLDPGDIRAREHLMTAQYASGDLPTAQAAARAMLESDPLNTVARAILGLDRPGDLYDFGKFMRENSGEIDLAFYFADLGLYADALRLLDEVYSEHVPNTIGVLYHGDFADVRMRPLQRYLLGWLAHKAGDDQKSESYLAMGKVLDPEYAFPANTGYVKVLDYAVGSDPSDANALLFRGNLRAWLSDLPGAVADWEASSAQPNASSIAFHNLAMHAWKKDGDLDEAYELFQRAIALRPHDQTLYYDSATVLIAARKRADAITLINGMPLDHPRRNDLTVLLAQAYNDEKRYGDAISLLTETEFSNWEMNTATWNAFHHAHVERGKLRFDAKDYENALKDFAMALTYPEHLGVGRSARPQESEARFWEGKALAALGRTDEARAAWTEGATGAEISDRQKEYIALCKRALGA
ncbi:MAG: DUF5107 domain-containing protein [Candidatus Hydrogenedentes bacterium]|nr:DUF5107 domain-containing protein [Candidatus Hydrogenedentota bacterium]